MGRFPIEIVGLGKQAEIIARHADAGDDSNIGEGNLTNFSVLSGGGLEFKGHREYTMGDDSRAIDWKASLRSDKLLVKEYYQEKSLDVVFLYDVSGSMLFGSQKKIKAHYGAEFILALTTNIVEANHNVGLVCFSDKITKSFYPKSGQTQVTLFLNVLGDHSTYGGKFDLAKALEFASNTYNPGSVLILVSDFLGNGFDVGHYKDKFRQVAQKFDLISVILRDPRDEFMPKDNVDVVVSSPFDNRQVYFNIGKVKKKYEGYMKSQRATMKKFFEESGSEILEIYTNESFVDKTIAFFKRRNSLLK